MKAIYLKPARVKARLTQQALAEKSGVPQEVISRLERNPDAKPTFGTVVNLADALKVDPRALRFGQPESMAS